MDSLPPRPLWPKWQQRRPRKQMKQSEAVVGVAEEEDATEVARIVRKMRLPRLRRQWNRQLEYPRRLPPQHALLTRRLQRRCVLLMQTALHQRLRMRSARPDCV